MTFGVSEAEAEAARAYEDLYVPGVFQQWAPRLVEAANVRSGHRVLDVACGTGVLAREAQLWVGADGFVAGLDAAPGMIAVAKQSAPSIDWFEGVADSLPFEDGSFDAIVSQFGLMYFPERREAISEMLRVLVPGGRLAVAVWDSLDKSEAYPIEAELFERLAGKPAADALKAPFVLGDQAKLVELFHDAGAASVEIATHHGTAQFPNIRTMVESDLRGWLPVMGVLLTEDVIQAILEEAETALGQYLTVAGTMEFDSPAHIVTGVKE